MPEQPARSAYRALSRDLYVTQKGGGRIGVNPADARFVFAAVEEAGYVIVPREALAHVLDWHNKKPCGVGQDSLDDVVFDALQRPLAATHNGAPDA